MLVKLDTAKFTWSTDPYAVFYFEGGVTEQIMCLKGAVGEIIDPENNNQASDSVHCGINIWWPCVNRCATFDSAYVVSLKC